MKKVFLLALALIAFNFASAQEEGSSTASGQTAKGKWLIEANTGFGGAHTADTGIRFMSQGDVSSWNIGLDGGYFIMDDLALKAGLGYGAFDNGTTDTNTFSYKIGAKYYVISKIPVSLDYTGSSTKDAVEDPSYLGFGAGYAIFLGENVSIEPGLRYNLSLNDDFTEDGLFRINIGFALHF
ncbi:MAG: autotransporter outer membrane beta-barrel domain-containing protein [Flavobacteriaceae bacterium]|nr:autotransporter outer membrane beta-barrel domain-containing protein [Flavobacteriaceae bacterium]